MFVELPILCHSLSSQVQKDLGIEIDEDNFEIRKGLVNLDRIVSLYPSSTGKSTIFHYDGGTFEVESPYDEIRKEFCR